MDVFNVGGSQSIEDSLKLVRNASHGKSLMFAFEGGYHGRTLGASSILPAIVIVAVTAISATVPSSFLSRILSVARKA